MSVLIVDDNVAMRKMLRKFAENYFERIDECSDGSEAIQYFYTDHPDVVVMDIKMKPMDGITATQQIISNFPTAKIIIVTDYGNASLRNAAAAAGAMGYVLKENLKELQQYFEMQTPPQTIFFTNHQFN